MAEHEDGQERTEQPTPRRLEQAREQGQVPRSRELVTLGLLLSGATVLVGLGSGLVSGLGAITRRGLEAGRRVGPTETVDLQGVLADLSVEALLLIAPLLIVVTVVALLMPLALGGWTFSGSLLSFKAERIDPAKGFKRVFGLAGLAELAKALTKLLVVGGAAALVLWRDLDRVLRLGQEPLAPALAHAGDLLAGAFLTLCGALVLVAALDVPHQLWQYRWRLRMSRQDLKEEFKETEGKPEVKSRIRALQREVARRRMMQEVPKADVVVTNPTHYAVALRYRPESMAAPRVVARGSELLALRIRDLAAEHRVPVLSAPPLARALYHGARLNQEIPAGLYVAVAQVLAYVFALRRQREDGGPAPPPPSDLPIPPELYHPA
jgi:flagellar biosynthetic protein FlhB